MKKISAVNAMRAHDIAYSFSTNTFRTSRRATWQKPEEPLLCHAALPLMSKCVSFLLWFRSSSRIAQVKTIATTDIASQTIVLDEITPLELGV
jgi:hypothetical protein